MDRGVAIGGEWKDLYWALEPKAARWLLGHITCTLPYPGNLLFPYCEDWRREELLTVWWTRPTHTCIIIWMDIYLEGHP